MQPQELMWTATMMRQADMRRSAEQERRATKTRTHHWGARVTLRVDSVWDSMRLYELAKLAGRRLPDDSFVVGELDGRIVAALPLGGGKPLTDPTVPTQQVVPLLELRAAQIRRVAIRRRAAWRSRLRRV
jgi:hypothetical protein